MFTVITMAMVHARAQPSSGYVDPALASFRPHADLHCTNDHNRSNPAFALPDAESCAAQCLKANAWGFQFDCDGKGTKAPCILLQTLHACGELQQSGCHSVVYVNNSSPQPIPPSPNTTYNLSVFEKDLLPKWVAQFQLPGAGNFSIKPNSSMPHPYATSDVAHVLCFVNQLDDYVKDEAAKDAWAKVINSYQRDDGFFENADKSGHEGGSLWHAAGYIPAGLVLLDRQPLRNNALFEHIASTPTLWEPTISALLNEDATPAPFNITSGCNSGYSCAQNIASLVSWFVQTNGSSAFGGGVVRHKAFIHWYLQFLQKQADPITGLWCTEAQQQKKGKINCIGGSFHIDFVFQFLVLHPEFATGASARAKFPFPEAQLNSSLALQKEKGGWTNDGLAYINVDGIYQATRPALQVGVEKPQARWADVRLACDRLMSLVVGALTNEKKLLGKVSSSTHNLPALVSAVAECQKHWPEMIHTDRPWKMCLDDVPYI